MFPSEHIKVLKNSNENAYSSKLESGVQLENIVCQWSETVHLTLFQAFFNTTNYSLVLCSEINESN